MGFFRNSLNLIKKRKNRGKQTAQGQLEERCPAENNTSHTPSIVQNYEQVQNSQSGDQSTRIGSSEDHEVSSEQVQTHSLLEQNTARSVSTSNGGVSGNGAASFTTEDRKKLDLTDPSAKLWKAAYDNFCRDNSQLVITPQLSCIMLRNYWQLYSRLHDWPVHAVRLSSWKARWSKNTIESQRRNIDNQISI